MNKQEFVASAPILTIGHSDRIWENLVETLQSYDIQTVVDIRTRPFSNHYPHFNQNVLDAGLPPSGIKYVYLGTELGARRTESYLLTLEGRVSYPEVRKTADFQRAIHRVENEAKEGHRLALLCMEGDPMKCHRFPMVAYQLFHDGFEVRHILKDGSSKTHEEMESELLRWYERKFPPSLFDAPLSKADQLEAAYAKLNLAIGYKPDASENRNFAT